MQKIKIPQAEKKAVSYHGLTVEEANKIQKFLGRSPNKLEKAIYGALWSEHCSYKSTKSLLSMFACTAPHLLQNFQENAGAVDIGDDEAIIFKIESHNHPSYYAPYQGAATGVGGILRDIFVMGARPIACMNSLRFGESTHEKTLNFVHKVVGGISHYANSFGVPMVGGECEFDAAYNDNILVNVFAAGLVKSEDILSAKAPGANLTIFYLGAKTGRDGIQGANFASQELCKNQEPPCESMQIADPFIGTCLMEAMQEMVKHKLLLAAQDMGAAGLSCAASEMGVKGKIGIQLHLENVPLHDPSMTNEDILLSETQERVLLILHPKALPHAKYLAKKWQLNLVAIGKTTDKPSFDIYHHKKLQACLPLCSLQDEAFIKARPYTKKAPPAFIPGESFPQTERIQQILLRMIGSENHSSRRWIFEQYDSFIQGNTIVHPGLGGGVIRLLTKEKALAFSCAVTARYCSADPFEGAKQAVAQAWRNLIALGATPLALSDNLNFGSPESPEIMGQIVETIKGISCAAQKLNFPVVSGNISLYNQNKGKAILPTPTIASVGLIKNHHKLVRPDSAKNKDLLFLIGCHGTHLGQSLYQKTILDKLEGAPPCVDLDLEKTNGDFVHSLIKKQSINACHDLSEGGLILALAKMAVHTNKGIIIKNKQKDYPKKLIHAKLFGEDQARYIISISANQHDALLQDAKEKHVELHMLGEILGKNLTFLPYIDIPIYKLKRAYENWFPRYIANKI